MISRRLRARRFPIVLILSASLFALGDVVEAGGDSFRVKVRDFARKWPVGATFTVVAARDTERLLGNCAQLRVDATYAWWKWWWEAPYGLSASAQARALDLLERASDDVIDFGYIGEGWHVAEPSQPCHVLSHALIELPRESPSQDAPSVYSFYKWP